MQTRTPLNAAASSVAGALLGWRAVSVRLATPVQAEDQPAANAELDGTVRQFFALADQHVRWELNDLAQRSNDQPAIVDGARGLGPAPARSVSGLSPDGRRMLQAISELPEDEREVFDLVGVEGMTLTEAAQVLGVSAETVKRLLNRGLLLTEQLADLPRRVAAGRDIVGDR
jgi:RNA polymerase sigma-70 factor (ECF subfamily)